MQLCAGGDNMQKGMPQSTPAECAIIQQSLRDKRLNILSQVLRKEQAMSEDSAFLKGQMEALLKVVVEPITYMMLTGQKSHVTAHSFCSERSGLRSM